MFGFAPPPPPTSTFSVGSVAATTSAVVVEGLREDLELVAKARLHEEEMAAGGREAAEAAKAAALLPPRERLRRQKLANDGLVVSVFDDDEAPLVDYDAAAGADDADPSAATVRTRVSHDGLDTPSSSDDEDGHASGGRAAGRGVGVTSPAPARSLEVAEAAVTAAPAEVIPQVHFPSEPRAKETPLPTHVLLQTDERAAAAKDEGNGAECVSSTNDRSAHNGDAANGGLPGRSYDSSPEIDLDDEQFFKIVVPQQFPLPPGVQYRKSMNIADRYSRYADNGSVVRGTVEGDWLRVRSSSSPSDGTTKSSHSQRYLFLPFRMEGKELLHPVDSHIGAAAERPPSSPGGFFWTCCAADPALVR